MKRLMLLIAVTLICSCVLVQAQPSAADSPQRMDYSKRDLALEREALAQREKIDAMLAPLAKHKLGIVFEAFLKRLLSERKNAAAARIIREELARAFGALSEKQTRILTFYVVTGVIKKVPPKSLEEATAEREKLKDKKDSISEMNEMDMLMLQQMLEKKNQLESMISNVMKAGFEGGQAAIQALKAS